MILVAGRTTGPLNFHLQVRQRERRMQRSNPVMGQRSSFSLYPRHRPLHLQRPKPSDCTKNISPISQPRNGPVASRHRLYQFAARPFNRVTLRLRARRDGPPCAAFWQAGNASLPRPLHLQRPKPSDCTKNISPISQPRNGPVASRHRLYQFAARPFNRVTLRLRARRDGPPCAAFWQAGNASLPRSTGVRKATRHWPNQLNCRSERCLVSIDGPARYRGWSPDHGNESWSFCSSLAVAHCGRLS